MNLLFDASQSILFKVEEATVDQDLICSSKLPLSVLRELLQQLPQLLLQLVHVPLQVLHLSDVVLLLISVVMETSQQHLDVILQPPDPLIVVPPRLQLQQSMMIVSSSRINSGIHHCLD